MQNSRFDFAAVDCCHATYFSQRVCAARCCLPTAWCVHDWGTSVSTRAAHRRVVRVCSRGATSGRGKCVDPHWVRGGPCPGQHAVHGNMRSTATCGFKFLSAPSGEKLHDTLCEKLHAHCTGVSLHLAWATKAALPGRAKIHPHALAPELVLRAFAGGPSSATVLNFRHF